MKHSIDGKATYYAFISHKSADARFALKLQRFIELYNLPTEVQRKANISQKRLTPICSYEIDFSSNPLMDEMRDKLKRSKYLILLCSKELLQTGTKYVNYEIRTFIECKKEEGIDPLTRIIPIIVSGEFGSGEDDCCPEALKELGDNAPIALDRKKYKNDRELFLHAISGMLDIDYAVLENRDKKRQRRKKMILGASLAGLLTGCALLGEYYIPRQYHYLDFVLKNGIPEGIHQLSPGEYKSMEGHYVVTRQMHKIRSLEYVDAYGRRIDHQTTITNCDRPAAYIFDYTSSGLSSVTYENKFGVPYFIMQYSADTLTSVDFKDPYDPAEAYFLGSCYESDPAKMLADYNTDAHSNISRFEYEYTPEGYIKKVTFCADTTGRLAQDNGVYGFEYVLDTKGRVIETYFLDAQGECRLNSEGLYCRKFTYDEQDDFVEWKNYGRNEILTANAEGITHAVSDYDGHNLIRGSFYDEKGDPVYVESYGAASQVRHLDHRGKLILGELLDEQGQPMYAGDYCTMAFTYDHNGFRESRTYLNAEGKAVVDTAVNYATVQWINDQNGNPIETTFYDADGNLIDNAFGYARETIEYDENGKEIKNSYFLADGKPADYRGYGYSTKITAYDERGRETSTGYFGMENDPVEIAGPADGYGYHKLETVYDYGAFTKITQTYYGADGEPVNVFSRALGELYSQSVIYFQDGAITYSANYCSDGSVYGDIIERKIDRTAKSETVETYLYTDVDGNVSQETINHYSINGAEMKTMTYVYGINGNVASEYTIIYHDNGRRKEAYSTEYSEEGNVIHNFVHEYDEDGRETSAVMVTPDDPEAYTNKTEYVYAPDGAMQEEKSVILDIEGTIIFTYDTVYHPDGTKKSTKSASYEGGRITIQVLTEYENDLPSASKTFIYDENGNVVNTID